METRLSLQRLLGLALMALAAAAAWWHTPEQPAETLVERWGMPPSRFEDMAGRIVHLRDEGPRPDPEPLVLLHGLGGSLHDWEPWSVALRATHRVIRLDLPGSGLTSPAADDDYRVESDARAVLALLDRLNVQRFRLMAQGRGGAVAAQVALLAPQRATRLLLVAGALPQPEAVPPVLRLGAALPWPAALVNGLMPRPLLADALRQLYADPARLSDAQIDRRRDLLLREGNRWALLQQWRQAPSGEAGTAPLARLRLPVLLLWGAQDRLTPPALGEALRAVIPGSRLQLLDGVGHLPQEEAPGQSLAAVLPFVEAGLGGR
jgi:pimeloyl-ACP methyl ester carboxylesterase